MKNLLLALLGFFILAILIFSVYFIVTSIFSWFKELPKELAISLITASSTIIVATLTISLGKYFERLKEIESHHRAKKVEIYDEFLVSVFNVFFQHDENFDLVSFLQKWQRKIILWASPEVLNAFVNWKSHMGSHPKPDANTFFLMENVFKAMRKDIGLSNRSLNTGLFSHFIMREAELFLKLSKNNPNITLEEISIHENKLNSSYTSHNEQEL